MYEIGKVYIWQNQVAPYDVLNGTECTVVSPPIKYRDRIGQRTDTVSPHMPPLVMGAERGDLRPKNPPPGEQLINEMFYVNVTA